MTAELVELARAELAGPTTRFINSPAIEADWRAMLSHVVDVAEIPDRLERAGWVSI